MSYEDEPMDQEEPGGFDPAQSLAADKVRLPAIFLIVVGVLNVLAGLVLTEESARVLLFRKNVDQEVDKAFQEQRLKSTQLSKQDQQQQEAILNWMQGFMGKGIVGANVTQLIIGLLGIGAAAVTIFGGVRMLSLRSRGLAVFGSVLACIPCLSVTGCCGLGEGIGIWSLIILMSADVKSAFR